MAAVMLAGTLALAGCGGGSDDTTPPPADNNTTPPPAPPPSGNDQVDNQSGKAAAAALAARDPALLAETAAETAEKAMMTLAEKGNPAAAAMNAHAILDADTKVKAQVTAAQSAVKEIEAAIAALPADTVNRAGVLESLNDDLRSAKGYLAEIQAIKLEGEVYAIKGQLDKGVPSVSSAPPRSRAPRDHPASSDAGFLRFPSVGSGRCPVLSALLESPRGARH